MKFADGALVVSDTSEVISYKSMKTLWKKSGRISIQGFLFDTRRAVVRSPEEVAVYNPADGKELGVVVIREFIGDVDPKDLIMGETVLYIISGRGELVGYRVNNGSVQQLWQPRG